MKIRLFTCSFVLLSIMLNSCTTKRNKPTTHEDSLLTKTIVFPHSLKMLDGNAFYSFDRFSTMEEGKSKIISIIDGTCSACIINQMNKLDSVFSNILIDSDNIMVFVLNVSKQDSSFFMRNLQPAINAKGIILWDNNFNFERENNLFTPDINLRTFMVNRKNRIIQYGNPLMHPDIIWEYKAKLEDNI